MRILLWQGFHGDAGVGSLIARALAGELLLVLCPPRVEDFDFVRLLPPGEIEFAGAWAKPTGFDERRLPESNSYPERPALAIFTSGTTEKPKLVLYSSRNIESCASAIYGLFDQERITEVFCYPQPFHTFGLTLGYAAAELLGWKFHAPAGKYSRAHHDEWLARADAGTLTLGTPTHFSDLLDHVKASGHAPSPSYGAILGGAKVSRALWLRVQGELEIEAPSVGYGATEASPGVTHLAPGRAPAVDGEVGFPLPQLEVEVDSVRGVTFRGPSVALASIQDDRLEFPREFTLPDLMGRLADGSLVFEGRASFLLNRGGAKLALELAEREIQKAFGLDALCFALPHPRLGEELGIYLRGEDRDIETKREAIFSHLRERFHMNFDSRNATAVAEFPRNANEKVDRRRAALDFGASQGL